MTDTNTAACHWLDRLERAGNRLPDPVTLFLAGTALVMLLSQLAVGFEWSVEKTLSGAGQDVSEQVGAVGLLDSDGLWWIFSHLVENFVAFPPLGLVLPYSIAFALLWGLMLGLWVAAGWPLGPAVGLLYPVPG